MVRTPIRLLLVAAHPADCFDQAGGTLAHHAADGDQVTVALASTGVRTHDFRLIDERISAEAEFDIEAKIKQAEQEKLEETGKACSILGYDDVRLLGFEDDQMVLTEEMVNAVADMIRELRPHVIITHHPYEEAGFKFHGTIGRATVYAWKKAEGTGRGKQAQHFAPHLYFMGPMAYVHGPGIGYGGFTHIDVFVDISDVIDKKVRAMDCISSQYYSGAYARKSIEMSDGAYGNVAKIPYAEAFQRVRPLVVCKLPCTDYDILLSEETKESGTRRVSTMIAARMPLPEGQVWPEDDWDPRQMHRL